MASIYIHIPFCKTRCIYCDFYSTTRSELQSQYVGALCRELRMRKDYLKGEAVKTVYFGGGTPSQLNEEEFRQLFDVLEATYGLGAAEEITLEANPDDLTEEYAAMLRRLPFDRISIGIQTFDDIALKLLNRRHNARQAVEAVAHCRKAGFRNISLDLIYGLPGETDKRWEDDLQQAIRLDVEHISAYHLTYEEGTSLWRMLQADRIHEVDEESSLRFFTTLMDQLDNAGYEHYEISNFCKPGRHSRHNTAYWRGIPYLGCGPSAHSFDIETRQWNTASLEGYIRSIEAGRLPCEAERLDLPIRYNEYVMTALRTVWGINLDRIESRFGKEMRRHCTALAAPYIENGKLACRDGHLCLTRKGIFTCDGIISDLMWV